jgi:hypothetical protein
VSRSLTPLDLARNVHTHDVDNSTAFPGEKRSALVATGHTGLQGNTAVSRMGEDSGTVVYGSGIQPFFFFLFEYPQMYFLFNFVLPKLLVYKFKLYSL